MADQQHKDIVGFANLHPPKGFANGNVGETYVADGAGSGSMQPLVQLPLMPEFMILVTIDINSSKGDQLLIWCAGPDQDIEIVSATICEPDAWTGAGGTDGTLEFFDEATSKGSIDLNPGTVPPADDATTVNFTNFLSNGSGNIRIEWTGSTITNSTPLAIILNCREIDF